MGAGQGLRVSERLFYDGGCGLCHWAVRVVLAQDKEAAFRFAPLGGPTFLALVPAEARAGLPDSLVVLDAEGRLLVRSAAAIHLLRTLGGPWALLGAAGSLLPARLADGLYDTVARVRGRLFRRPAEACPAGPEALRERFDP